MRPDPDLKSWTIEKEQHASIAKPVAGLGDESFFLAQGNFQLLVRANKSVYAFILTPVQSEAAARDYLGTLAKSILASF
ncbi:hypothetical protein ACFFWD_41610 [Bradyrhizobium erythrophlei]|uniref:hypothetical protein n=1 Tax=Bradyrhizobium erythrophlei TaxID=1437360 RepID=UPI0035E5AEB9